MKHILWLLALPFLFVYGVSILIVCFVYVAGWICMGMPRLY